MVRKRTKRSNTRMLTRFRRQEHRLQNGYGIKGKSDPPPFTPAPWWPLTVILKLTGSTKITPKIISTQLQKQLPQFPQTAKSYQLRIQSVRLWLASFPVSMRVNSTINGRTIKELTDYPTPFQFAHVGWKYGEEHALFPLENDDNTLELFSANAHDEANKATILCYVGVLLRFYSNEVTLAGLINDVKAHCIKESDYYMV